MKPKIVRISNQVVRCVQQLTISEKRLLMLIISSSNGDDVGADIVTTAKEYALFYGVAQGSAYSTLKSAQDKLWNRQFVIEGKRKRWLITSDYIPQEGQIESRIHPDLTDHIHDLKSHYTQYYLRRAGNFKSTYSWRLFELLMQFRKTGLLKISVAELKELLEIPESYDRDFALVRIKVIGVALKEIKAGGLPVKLKTIKKGRNISMLEFTFPTEQQADWIPKQLDAPETAAQTNRVTKSYIEKHARPGETYESARQRLERELKQSQEAAQAK